MSKTKDLMIGIYNTLVQIKYPKITTTTAENVEFTILNGDNRLSLLSWLLCEKSPTMAQKLQKLEGTTLEDEILKYYSEIGICIDKKLLLGKCPLAEQLPTLELLLHFIRCVFIESSSTEFEQKECVDAYINKDAISTISNIQPTLSYSESVKYFNDLQQYLKEHEELLSNCDSGQEEHIISDISEEGKKEDESEISKLDSLFNTGKKNFIEAFSSIESWPVNNVNEMKNNMPCMDDVMNDIHTNFSFLIKFLRAKEEISNTNIPKEIQKLCTLLNEIIEEANTHTEEAKNMFVDNY